MYLKNKSKILQEKGITLIALVVTIVVLLILAGVSISMLSGDDEILTQASKAAIETRGASVEEARDLWEANKAIDDRTSNSTAQTLDELLADLEEQNLLTSEEVATVKETGQVTIGSRTIVFDSNVLTLVEMFEQAQKDSCTNEDGTCTREDHLHIGDYVDFQNPTSGSYIIESNKSGINMSQTYSAANNQNLNWRVLGIDETTKGLKLISGRPMKLDNIDGKNDPYLYLYGAWAYEYGTDEMDAAVRKIYGDIENVADARSVKEEDIDYLTGITTDEKIKEVNLDKYYGSKQYGEYFSYLNQYTPESWINSKQKVIVEGSINGYYYTINSPVESGAPYVTMNNTRAYNLLFNNVESKTGAHYWLSFQGVSASLNRAGFGPGLVDATNCVARTGSYGTFKSDGNDSIECFSAVRPVIILKPDVTGNIIKKINDQTEENWNYNGGNWEVNYKQ